MLNLRKGRYLARFAASEADLHAAQDLRYRAFFGAGRAAPLVNDGAATPETPLTLAQTARSTAQTPLSSQALAQASRSLPRRRDHDSFDPRCRHVLIEEEGALVACFRLLELASGTQIDTSYAAQFYDLAALRTYPGALLEMGRFCLAPNRHDPDILRLAWGAVTRLVDAGGVKLLFGCSSFPGTDASAHRLAFAQLSRHHQAPPLWAPRQKTPLAVPLRSFASQGLDPMAAARAMPPLLRSYLALGGWVSDHAVVDPQMNTLHVFTGVEIDKVPPARAKLLRAVAG